MAKMTVAQMREELSGYAAEAEDALTNGGIWEAELDLLLPAMCDAGVFFDHDSTSAYVIEGEQAHEVFHRNVEMANQAMWSLMWRALNEQIGGASDQQIRHYHRWATALINR